MAKAHVGSSSVADQPQRLRDDTFEATLRAQLRHEGINIYRVEKVQDSYLVHQDSSVPEIWIQLRWDDEDVWKDCEVLDRNIDDDKQIEKIRLREQFTTGKPCKLHFRYGRKGGRPMDPNRG